MIRARFFRGINGINLFPVDQYLGNQVQYPLDRDSSCG